MSTKRLMTFCWWNTLEEYSLLFPKDMWMHLSLEQLSCTYFCSLSSFLLLGFYCNIILVLLTFEAAVSTTTFAILALYSMTLKLKKKSKNKLKHEEWKYVEIAPSHPTRCCLRLTVKSDKPTNGCPNMLLATRLLLWKMALFSSSSTCMFVWNILAGTPPSPHAFLERSLSEQVLGDEEKCQRTLLLSSCMVRQLRVGRPPVRPHR